MTKLLSLLISFLRVILFMAIKMKQNSLKYIDRMPIQNNPKILIIKVLNQDILLRVLNYPSQSLTKLIFILKCQHYLPNILIHILFKEF